jgi:hypothetical protein
VDERAVHLAAWEKDEKFIQYFLRGKPEGKTPLGRHGLRWDDNIRMDLTALRS